MPYRTYILDVLVKTCWRYLVKVILIGLGERSPEADIVVRNNVSLKYLLPSYPMTQSVWSSIEPSFRKTP